MISSQLLPQRAIFDDAPIGVMESGLDGTVRYANPEALNILGAKSFEGLSLRQLFVNTGELDLQLQSRRDGLIGSYQTELVRQNDGQQIAVEITAIPVVAKSGEIEATLAFFRHPIEEEINRIHQEADGANTVLYKVMVEICKVIPCDLVTVTRYSEDLQHSQPLFQLKPRNEHGRVKWRKAWQSIPEFLRPEVRATRTTLHRDIQTRLLHESMELLRGTPVVEDLISEQVQVAIRHPVQKANKKGSTLFASVTFYSKSPDALTEEHLERINDLPIAASVIQAFDFFDRKRETERFRLLQEIAHCPTIDAVCDAILRRLWDIFGWGHVSLYRVDHAIGRIKFLACCNGGNVVTEPKYEQSSNQGVFGRVVRSGKPELVRDTKNDIDFIPHKTFGEAQSEMCWPLMIEDDTTVRWIIDVLDSRPNAFAEEEQRWLGEVAHEVGGYMQRLSTLHFLTECMNGTSDAIIVTDSQSRIKRANAAAAKLFGATDSKSITGDLESFFAIPEKGTETLSSTRDHLGVCLLRRLDGSPAVEVDISRRSLPDDIGGSIYVLKSMNEIWRALKLELLEKTVYEIATETRTPLSIAIDEIERATSAQAVLQVDSMDRILRYLYRVQHAYTKLTMFNPRVSRDPSERMRLDLATEIRVIYKSLPDEMRVLVDLRMPTAPVKSVGDAFQINFVLETLLVFLIRNSPEKVPVRVFCDENDGVPQVRFEGFLPSTWHGLEDSPPETTLSADLRIAYPLLRDFVECNHGTLRTTMTKESDRISFFLSLPPAN
jgi:PAS domain S-box-containing protein